MKNVFKGYLIALVTFFTSFIAIAQPGHPDSLKNYRIQTSLTDANLPFELAKHYAWFNPDANPRNQLLVFMPGTFDNPKNVTYFNELAANYGYHVVNLKYPNSKSAQTACRTSSDVNCYENFRKEIIEGTDLSSETDTDTTNSILNRLKKLIEYLQNNYPNQNWSQYVSGDSLHWSKMLLSGHSQGGGHAALLAKYHSVYRVIMFASPNDYSAFYSKPAKWTEDAHLSHDSTYYAFGNTNDDVVDFSEQYAQWINLGLDNFGDTIHVNNAPPNYNNHHQLYTTEVTSGTGDSHSNMIRDDEVSLDPNNRPVYEKVWRYLLGIKSPPPMGSYKTDFQSDINIYPTFVSNGGSIYIESKSRTPLTYSITDLKGAVVAFGKLDQIHTKIPSDRIGKSGNYVLNLTDTLGKSVKQFKFWVQ